MEDLKNNHLLHALLIGGTVSMLTKNGSKNFLLYGASAGGGAYAYMSKYGHGTPFTNEGLDVSTPASTKSSQLEHVELNMPSLKSSPEENKPHIDWASPGGGGFTGLGKFGTFFHF